MGTSASALQGTIIAGRYRVVRELGAGGMGAVVEVEHVDLGRPFALKLLRLGQRGEEIEQRFRREARALALVRSARVAQVTDFGVDDTFGPWYVMELVDGESLEDRIIREGALPVAEVARLGAALCEAVADVHDASLVHRDLKPSNIGLPATGPVAVKLIDFGLAASIDDAFLTRITQSQQVLGSLPYIAPEQFAGARPSPAADLWSVGVVLHEMLTGRLPFEAPSTAALMHAILTAPPPRVSGLPADLDALLRRLLEKDPGGRPASARVVAERLGALAESLSSARALLPTRASALDAAPPSATTSPFTTTPDPARTSLSVGESTDPATRTSSTSAVTIPARPRWGLWVGVALAAAALAGLGIKWALDAWAPPPANVEMATPPPLIEPASLVAAPAPIGVDAVGAVGTDAVGGTDAARTDAARNDAARNDAVRNDAVGADAARAGGTLPTEDPPRPGGPDDTAERAGATPSTPMTSAPRTSSAMASTPRPRDDRAPVAPTTEDAPAPPRMQEGRPQGWRGGIIEDPE